MQKIAAVVMYDGTNYAGWQSQSNKLAIQDCIENAFYKIFNKKVKICASGRTDAGVHAEGQVFHFISPSQSIPPSKFANILNAHLPSDIKILRSVEVDTAFHARYGVIKKTYEYNMYVSNIDLPLKSRYSTRILDVDINLIKSAAQKLCGTHDFAAFCASGSSVKDTVRTIYSIIISKNDNNDVKFVYTGSGFLYNMVRIMSGALVDVGQNKISIDHLVYAMQQKDRKLLGKTLSAKGLVLKNTQYPNIYKIY